MDNEMDNNKEKYTVVINATSEEDAKQKIEKFIANENDKTENVNTENITVYKPVYRPENCYNCIVNKEQFEDIITNNKKDIVLGECTKDVIVPVFCLSITHENDDYKHRDDAYSETFLYSSKEKCTKKIRKYILEQTLERLQEYDEAPKQISKYFSFIKKNEDDEYETWEFAHNFDDEHCFDELYEWHAKGEYVPYSWTYDISVLKIE